MADILNTYLEILIGLSVYFGIASLFFGYFIWVDRHKPTHPRNQVEILCPRCVSRLNESQYAIRTGSCPFCGVRLHEYGPRAHA